MPAPKKAKRWSQLYWLLLLPIPLLWCVVAYLGGLTFLEHKTVDWRFRARGELKPPVKVIYVDVDSLSINQIGNQPWSRTYYARVAEALVKVAGVKAVAFDFVFSDAGLAESADIRKIVKGNLEFGPFLHGGPPGKAQPPPVVLAAGYAGWHFVDIDGLKQERVLRLVATDTRPLDRVEPPETPQFQTSVDPDRPKLWSPPHIGLIDTLGNETRVVPAYAPTLSRQYFHMGLELARLYWGLPAGALRVADDAVEFVRADGGVHARVPLREKQLLDVNWFTRWNSPHTQHIEFVDVYKYAEMVRSDDAELQAAGREFFGQDAFKDAVVLVGPVDRLLQDIAPTPLDEDAVPRVGVHGNVLMTVLAGKYLSFVSRPVEYALIVGLSLVAAVLVLAGGGRSAVLTLLGVVLVVGAYAGAAFLLFAGRHVVLPLVTPVGSALMMSFVGLSWRVIAEQKAKSRIKGMFGTYLAPTVVERMIESGTDPELGGHDAEITAYFSDIQKFSSFSEVLSAAQLTELLNEYLTACTDIVQAEMGTLDKYIGDAVVAMFGAPLDAPDHAFRACVASQRVQQRVAELRAKWRGEGDRWPLLVHNLRTRIGLNTGVCMIGNMGSRSRFNYTMMGDNVNLAARMESGAKSWGVYTMCTDATKQACQSRSDRVVFRALGRIVVQGRSQPVPVHEIVGLTEDVSDRTRECIALFEAALEKYYARDWQGALQLLGKSRALEPNQPDKSAGIASNPSLVYTTIVQHCEIEPPPPGWDGRYVMTEK